MPERRFSLPAGGAYTLTDATIASLLSTGSGDAARVYLYLLRQSGQFDERTLCADLGLAPALLTQTLTALQRVGLLAEDKLPPSVSDVRPDYSGREVAYQMENTPAFRHVVEETQRRLGRVLSSSDLQILFGMYDWRGLPPGVISLLIAHCLDDAYRRYGPGRMPTLRQIDKLALIWEQEGIDTEERAEQYILSRESSRQVSSGVFRALGITSRSPSPSEQRYVSEWVEAGFSTELITLAYDRTVLKTGGLNWKYMNTILKSWQEKGLFTLEAVETGDARPTKAGAPAPAFAPDKPAGSKDAARGRDAVERMKRYVKDE